MVLVVSFIVIGAVGPEKFVTVVVPLLLRVVVSLGCLQLLVNCRVELFLIVASWGLLLVLSLSKLVVVLVF